MIRESAETVTEVQRSVPARDKRPPDARTAVQPCGYLRIIRPLRATVPGDQRGAQVESDERYYRRRAVEERMAAQRAMTETARAWHAKLAEDYAARAGPLPIYVNAVSA